FRKHLASDPDENLRAIPRKQRAMVRKGIANKLSATVSADVDGFFSLYADNVHRHGTPALPVRYFRALAVPAYRGDERCRRTERKSRPRPRSPLQRVCSLFLCEPSRAVCAGWREDSRQDHSQGAFET